MYRIPVSLAGLWRQEALVWETGRDRVSATRKSLSCDCTHKYPRLSEGSQNGALTTVCNTCCMCVLGTPLLLPGFSEIPGWFSSDDRDDNFGMINLEIFFELSHIKRSVTLYGKFVCYLKRLLWLGRIPLVTFLLISLLGLSQRLGSYLRKGGEL